MNKKCLGRSHLNMAGVGEKRKRKRGGVMVQKKTKQNGK
jgi:hypothetical protein